MGISIIASHGKFRWGIHQSGSMIFGEQEKVQWLLSLQWKPWRLVRSLQDAIAPNLTLTTEILVLADLWSGSPTRRSRIRKKIWSQDVVSWQDSTCQCFIQAYTEHMVAPDAGVEEIVANIYKETKKALKSFQVLIPKEDTKPADAKPSVPSAIPEGTVLGDGKIKYVLARVWHTSPPRSGCDWLDSSTHPDRIIVVSNTYFVMINHYKRLTSRSHLVFKFALSQLKTWLKRRSWPRFGDTRAMLLFESVEDAFLLLKQVLMLK